MKKIYLTLLLSLPLFSDGFLFDPLSKNLHGKSFISLGLVQQNTDSYGNSQALNLSYNFIHKSNFGVEVGYVQSLDEAKHKTKDLTTDFSSVSAFATHLLAFDPHIGLKTKVGYAKNKHAEDGLAYGAELIFQVTKTTGLSVSYHQMNKDMKYIMINTVYRLKH